MNDQLPNVHPSMFHVSLSSIFPSKTAVFLSALLPGLFFELCVALANPELFKTLVAGLPQGFPLGPYFELGIALFLGFAVGNAFMMGVTMIQWLVGRLYALAFFFRTRFCPRQLLPWVDRVVAKRLKPGQPPSRRMARFLNCLHNFSPNIDQDQGDIEVCLEILSAALLRERYGITSDEMRRTRNWSVFYVNLWNPTGRESRGYISVIATHATGWSGLIATRVAPRLSNRYYVSFCVLMIAAGLLHDYYLAKNKNNPILRSLTNVRGLLREFGKIPGREDPSPLATRNPG